MYERLLDAIERRIDDTEFIQELADLLYYCPDTLLQDLQALRERVDQV